MEECDGQRPDEKQPGTQKAQEAESGNRIRELLPLLKAAGARQDGAICEAREVNFLEGPEPVGLGARRQQIRPDPAAPTRPRLRAAVP